MSNFTTMAASTMTLTIARHVRLPTNDGSHLTIHGRSPMKQADHSSQMAQRIQCVLSTIQRTGNVKRTMERLGVRFSDGRTVT
jgi:hypothetical protein